MSYRISLTKDARQDLANIKDVRIRQAINKALLRLQDEPHKRGARLADNLAGFWSLHCVGNRYRAIYDIQELEHSVIVRVIAIRKEGDKHDAYSIASKRLV